MNLVGERTSTKPALALQNWRFGGGCNRLKRRVPPPRRCANRRAWIGSNGE
jgi:hypothetical protein